MATVQMAGNGFGGLIQAQSGNYVQAADGTFLVNTADVTDLLKLGLTFVQPITANYTTPLAPPAATVGGVIASGALSNGTVAVTTQPTVLRPATVEVGAGTVAITAGSVAVTYIGNDGQTGTDTFSLVCAASASTTQTLSRGVDTITSVVVSGVTGGASPFFRMSTLAQLSVPVAKGVIDFAIQREYDGGATVAIGALSSALASITPTTAPNGTLNYSFFYSYISPGT